MRRRQLERYHNSASRRQRSSTRRFNPCRQLRSSADAAAGRCLIDRTSARSRVAGVDYRALAARRNIAPALGLAIRCATGTPGLRCAPAWAVESRPDWGWDEVGVRRAKFGVRSAGQKRGVGRPVRIEALRRAKFEVRRSADEVRRAKFPLPSPLATLYVGACAFVTAIAVVSFDSSHFKTMGVTES